MIEAQATARYVRSSAQKAGLVCDLIRGKMVNDALTTLQFTKKIVAHEISKVLRSAVSGTLHPRWRLDNSPRSWFHMLAHCLSQI